MSEEFHEGDLVQAAKGRQYIVGYLNSDRDIVTENVTHTPAFLRNHGWTLTVIEKAAPKLPTDRGYYLSESESRTEGVLQLDRTGWWWWIGNNYQPCPESILPSAVAKHGNLTRLEPVPVTAKRVLDAIRQRIGSIDSAHDFQAVATQFGITE